jgi:hypothetical protein
MLWRNPVPSRDLGHNRARRIGFRDNPPLDLLIPSTATPHADLDLDPAPWLRNVNYMVDHICEPISEKRIACCRSARWRQGGEKRPLTVYLQNGSDFERRRISAFGSYPPYTAGLRVIRPTESGYALLSEKMIRLTR